MAIDPASHSSVTVPIGILATGIYLPEPRMTSEQLAEATGIPVRTIEDKFGILQKPMPGPEDHPCEMGARAADLCLKRAEVDPLEIDMVLSISEEYKEHPLMVSGIKIQQRIGARNAFALDVAQRCCTTIAGLKIARAMMRDDPQLRTVLLAGGYRNGDLIDYRNPRVSFMYSLAAAGGALLLRRGHDRNLLLESALISDGDFADDVNVAAGGTVLPLRPDLLGTAACMLDVHDVEGMKARLARCSHANFMRVIEQCVQRSGKTVAQIDYLALLHMKRSAHDATLEALGKRPDQSFYLQDCGHLGQFDPILSIEQGVSRGSIRRGSLVVMASAGVSYAWGAQAIRWG